MKNFVRIAKKFLRLFAMTSVLVVPVIYNNCSPRHKESSFGFLSGLSLGDCSTASEEELFTQTYHPFLVQNCSTCHVAGEVGAGSFASPAPQEGFDAFAVTGFTRISEYATNPTHKPPYTGTKHSSIVNTLQERWIEGLRYLEECQVLTENPFLENQDDPKRISTIEKKIVPNRDAPQTITWKLDEELIDNPNATMPELPQATFSMDIQVVYRPGSITYVISRPRINSPRVDVHLKSLLVKINGQAAPAQRTFFYLTREIRAWNSDHPDFNKSNANELRRINNLVSDGALVVDVPVTGSEMISVNFAELIATTLPPREEFPIVNFEQAKLSDTQEDGIVEVKVKLSKAWSELAVATIDFGPDTLAREECCTSIQNNDGDTITIDNFDRDFEVLDNAAVGFSPQGNTGVMRLNFSPGETEKSLRFKIIPDTREELDETIHLRLRESESTKLQVSTDVSRPSETQFNIIDNDQPYTGTARTFSQLMGPGGVLNTYCIRCHNSVDNRGGYDMTNYEQMINEGIITPGDTNSLMYLRMNTDDGILDPMPLDGLITEIQKRRQVEDWIKAGAENN